MSKPAAQSASYTPTITLQEHFEAILIARDERDRAVAEERDLRYKQLREADDKALQAALAAAEKAVSTALIAAEKAVNKAEVANEKRLENTNEWRQTYGDLARQGIGRQGAATAGWAYLIAGLGIAMGLASLFFAVTR